MDELEPELLRPIVSAALTEDLGQSGDITTEAVVPHDRRATGHLVARGDLVLAGVGVAREVFRLLDDSLEFHEHQTDGSSLRRGTRVATVVGKARPILEGQPPRMRCTP